MIITAVIVFSWALFFFGYRPRVHTLHAIQEQVHNIQEGALTISEFDSGRQSFSEFILSLKEKSGEVKEKFPSSEEPVIKAVLQLAGKHGISITSIKSTPKKLEAEEAKAVSPLGEAVKRIYLDIDGLGYYAQIGKFLKDLRENFNTFILLDSFRFARSAGTGKLNVHVKISFYVADKITQN